MARPKAEAPAISFHICGQAIAKFDGITFYLGAHNSAEAFAKYAYILREYQANGFKLPDHLTPQSVRQLAVGQGMEPPTSEKVDPSDEPIQVKHIVEAYRQHVLVRYRDSISEKNRLLQVCRILESEAGSIEVDKFGPRILQNMRSD